MTGKSADMNRPGKILPTDVGGAVLAGLGVLIASAESQMATEVVVHVCVMCLVLVATGSGVVVVGRRRYRQTLQEIDETRQRGFAGRHLIPLGDQIATVIARCSVTALISSILGTVVSNLMTVLRIPGVAGYRMLQSLVFWLIVVGSVSAIGWWTWRQLERQNRKLCEPVCPECGYVLYGVKEHRCPDCGRPFALTELNVTLLRIDEEGRLQPRETKT